MHYLCIHAYVIKENNLRGKNTYILDQGACRSKRGEERHTAGGFLSVPVCITSFKKLNNKETY